jgi:hypothetical protein
MHMTKYNFAVVQHEDGCRITVIRNVDNADKVFFVAGARGPGAVKSLESFMSSITDTLADGYFPQPRKQK